MAIVNGDHLVVNFTSSYLARYGLAVVVQQVPLLLAVLGFDVGGLPCFGAVQHNLYVGGLAETEETLRQETRKLK